MFILAIETSCDETAIAILKADHQSMLVLSNMVSSQVKIHAEWGGVVPNLAAREHLKNIQPVLEQALAEAKITMHEVDVIATTEGPGLIPALLIGTNVAKTLSYLYQKPMLGIHHIEGHIYANFIDSADRLNPLKDSDCLPGVQQHTQLPLLCLVASGGHTQLVLMQDHLEYEIIGQTLDDAVGEAFDKVAKILDLGYPGGPIVSQRAALARDAINNIADETLKEKLLSIKFPRPLLHKPNFDFSFSGLKTAVLYFWKNISQDDQTDFENIDQWKNAICLEFENAAIEVLVKKTLKAAKKHHPATILLAGGVAANQYLRVSLESAIHTELKNTLFIKPDLEFCGDNAAMIAVAAFYRYQNLKNKNQLESLADNWKTLEAKANWKLISLTR